MQTEPHDAITAACDLATVRTPIGCRRVTVITDFDQVSIFVCIESQDSVTAGTGCAPVGARVFINFGAIIALLTGTNDAVSTNFWSTLIAVIVGVAIYPFTGASSSNGRPIVNPCPLNSALW